MAARELIVLGTASQVPTRTRNHNGYLLRWDDDGLLFDPGEGTQRQLLLAGVPVSQITRICLTHFHGDHCLGVPGVLARLVLDRVPHEIRVHYPASGAELFAAMRRLIGPGLAGLRLVEEPVTGDGELTAGRFGALASRALVHGIDSVGYRVVEPDGRRMLPDRLAAHGIAGPEIGALRRLGELRGVSVDEVSEPRRGQRFAFIMDTRLCAAVDELAQDADLLVIESTFLDRDADLADRYGHLTVGQAAAAAARCGVRTLVLTHFSQRYPDPAEFHQAARAHFAGHLVVARDLDRVPLPARR